MILQICLKKKKVQAKLARSDSSFTLIELLIVATIIAGLIFFSTPLFRKQFSNLELKDTALRISRLINFAQERAIMDRCVYKISFDFDKKTYRLFAVTAEGEALRDVPLKDKFGRTFSLPQNIEIEGEKNEILFHPDGRCDVIELKLTNKNKKVSRISTTGVLGNVSIKEEK